MLTITRSQNTVTCYLSGTLSQSDIQTLKAMDFTGCKVTLEQAFTFSLNRDINADTSQQAHLFCAALEGMTCPVF